MAAEFRLHVLSEGTTEDDVKYFMGNVFGSKWFRGFMAPQPDIFDERYERVMNTDSIPIGDVSWLKAAVFEDGQEDFIPDAIEKISKIVGEDFPIIDDEMIGKIKGALRLENKTDYSIGTENEIVAWLSEHKGQQVFSISW